MPSRSNHSFDDATYAAETIAERLISGDGETVVHKAIGDRDLVLEPYIQNTVNRVLWL